MSDKVTRLSLLDWLTERLENTQRLAAMKSGDDRDGWLEDGRYFEQAIAALQAKDERIAELETRLKTYDTVRAAYEAL